MGQLPGIGDPDQPPVFVGEADRLSKFQMVKIAFYLILSVFNVYLSYLAHNNSSSTRPF
jgi:hypothetical protein